MGLILPKQFASMDFSDCLAAVRAAPPWTSFYTGPTPDELRAIYARGYQGVRPDSVSFDDKQKFGRMMAAMPRLYDIFPWAKGAGKGKICIPYLACMKFMAEWGWHDPQERGDCTVHGTANAAYIDYMNDCLWGETTFKGPLCCENIYRSRGFSGDGWSCEAPCYYIGPEGKGGLLYRKVYENGGEKVDLSRYNSSWSGNGRAGVPGFMEEESKKNKARWIIPITTAEEYRDAIAIGFGINVCSGQGFSSSTDEYGVARASGSWSHSMAHIGCIDTDWARSKYGDMIGCIQQSWGNWNSQNGKPEGVSAMSKGSFYSKFSTILSMLRGQDSFAVCSVYGWERTGWEAFVATDLINVLRNSTTQDYYKHRSERIAEYAKKSYEEFVAI